MKKVLALVLSALMLASVIAVIVAVPAAAVDGDWLVYSDPGEFYPDFDPAEDDLNPVPGYSYVPGEGLVVTPADWRDFTPKIGLSTRNKVDLKEGVYVLYRIDDFTYANDKWFSIGICDKQYINVGSTNHEKYGDRMSTLIRPDDNGKINGITWYTGNFTGSGSSNMTYDDSKKYDANGKPLLELVVTWDGSSYKVTINGAEAPQKTIDYLNEKYGGAESSAYLTLNLHNGNNGGTAAVTVMKFGKTAATATIPQGDDSALKRDSYIDIAEIADPSTVEANKPALLMNGSREASDSKGTTRNAGLTSLTPENYIHYKSDRANLEISFSPKYEKSYDIDDFPVIVVLTKNLCTCGESLADCIAIETANMYIMTGEYTSADDNHRLNMIDICDEPIVRGENSYLYFYVDTSDVEWLGWDAEGRFNGLRFDIKQINTTVPGMNEFDICFTALFRSLEEAEVYINEFIGPEELPPENTEDTDPPENTETQEPGNVETNPPVDNPGPDNGNKPGDDKPTDDKPADDNASSGGCFSSAGFGVIAMITLAGGASFIAFKKRK